MAITEPDEAFFRNYFAGYELESSSSAPIKFEHDLEDCNCAINCCFRFLPEVRLQLRSWYQRLTPAGRLAFLKAHLREASPGHVQYRLPTVGAGGLEKVCMIHFKDTLKETRERIRAVILEKRKPLEGCTVEGEEEPGDGLPKKRYKKGTAERALIMDRMARGLSYRTFNSRKLMPARKVKAPCDSVCKYKCYEKYTLEERQQKLKELLQLPLDKQREFLSDHVCKMDPIRPRILSPNRRLTIFYFFQEGRQLQRVCKTMFLNTYDITDRRLRELLEKKGANAHAVCGNPMLTNILKKYQYRRMVFDVDEGLDKEVDKRILKEFLSNGCVNLEGVQQEEDYDEISIDYGTVKQELDEAEQEILPEEPPASNSGMTEAESVQHSNTVDPAQPTDEIDPICNRVGETSTVWIKTENMEVDEPPTQDLKRPSVDIKAEQVELEERLVVPLPRCDDPVFEDSNYEPQETYENNFASNSAPPPSGNQLITRLVKPHCGTKCNMQCYTRVADELRVDLLANLHQMPPTKQRKFIGDHICAIPVILPLCKWSKRQVSNYYFLPVESRLVKVCKVMFCSTFDLNAKQVRDIIEEKGADKHVVCGNPNFSSVLKPGVGYYFEYNEGCNVKSFECKCSLRCSAKFSKGAIERMRSDFHKKTKDERYKFLFKYVKIPTGDKKLLYRARFFLPHGESPEQLEQVCRKMFLSSFKVEWLTVRTLLKELEANADSIEHAKMHISTYRMDEDHQCEVGDGAVRKLSRCPNVAQMYNEYLEGNFRQQQDEMKPIDYQQYFGEFSQYFTRTGLLLPTRCSDCGFFSSEDCG